MQSWINKQYDSLENIWKQAPKRKRTWIYLGVYTVVFLITFLIAYSPFLIDKTSFVWYIDGREQYFPVLVYVGKSLRLVLQNALKGDFSIPFFDLNMNMGDDIIGYLNSVGGTDPLLLLSAFIPPEYSEHLYNFLVILHLYLAGLSFSALCFYFKKPHFHVLIGSIVYCFSGYAVVCVIRHPFYINSMFLFPLLIIGLDKILKKERPYLFIISVFLSVLNTGYYFLYMMTIMLGVYALVRFFDLYKEKRLIEFCHAVLRGILGYVLGIGLSAVILFPSVFVFLSSGREGHSNYIPESYTWTYFRDRWVSFVAPMSGSGVIWSNPVFAAIVLFALILLYASGRRRTLKTLVAIAVFTWMSSVGGFIMNGFQYSSNRWVFGLVLLMAFIVVEMLPELLDLSGKQKVMYLFVICVYVAICIPPSAWKAAYVIVGQIFLIATLLVLAIPLKKRGNEARGDRKARNFRGIICLLLVAANTGVNGIYFFAPDQGNYIEQYASFEDEIARLENAEERELEPYLSDAPEGRADSTAFTCNTSMVWRIPTMLTYSSTLADSTSEFWMQLDRSEDYSYFKVSSTDQRTIPNTLLSTKYHMEPSGRSVYVPYGYTQIEETSKGNIIYENEYALPWGYTYDNIISYDALEDLNGLQKQEAMLQAVALETAENEEDILRFDGYDIPYEIKFNNCKWEDGKLAVFQGYADATMTFTMPAGVEGYLYFSGFDINDSELSSFTVTAACSSVHKGALVKSNLDNLYYGRENYLFNLGYSEEERTLLNVIFPSKGNFRLDDIVLYALPMDHYPERVEALRAEPLKNITWGTNRLSGTVDLSGDKILCMSIPYSKGWSATVDGKKVKILRGNYMFMAIPLTAGHHDIEFSYCPPGLKIGAVVSIISVVIVVWMLIRERKRKRI